MEETLNQTQNMDGQELPTQPETAPEMPQEAPPTPKSGNKLLMLFGILIILLSLGMGYFAYQTMQLREQITATPSPSPTTDPTAGWETYEQNGYSIKHPSDWTISSIPFGFAVVNGNYKINIEAANPAYGPGICIFSDSPDFSNPYPDDPILAASKCPGDFVEIKGLNGAVFRREASPSTTPEGILSGSWSIFVKDDQGNFVTVPPIGYTIPVPNYDKGTILIMDQIVSTFEFTGGSNSTENWKVYTNANAGITFKHPTNITQESVVVSGPLVGNANLVGSFADKSTVAQGTDKPFDGFSVYEVDPNSLGVSFDKYIAQEVEAVKNNPEFPAPNAKASQTTIGGKTFTYIDTAFGSRIYYILSPLGNRIVIFSKSSGAAETIFDRILSTFEFTN